MREVIWSERATGDLARLDRNTANRISQAVLRFAQDGYGDVKKLRGTDDRWRLRVGDWRAILTFGPGTILVIRVLPRDRAYRD